MRGLLEPKVDRHRPVVDLDDHVMRPNHLRTIPNDVLISSEGFATFCFGDAFPFEPVAFPFEPVAFPFEPVASPRQLIRTSCFVVVSRHGVAWIRRYLHACRRCLLRTACFVIRTTKEEVSRTCQAVRARFEVLRTSRRRVEAACLILRT
jgi:hypothetical protein